MPSGISNVSAASGPYAAELSASKPKIGIPFSGPIRSAFSSFGSQRPPKQQAHNVHRYPRGGRYHNLPEHVGTAAPGCPPAAEVSSRGPHNLPARGVEEKSVLKPSGISENQRHRVPSASPSACRQRM